MTLNHFDSTLDANHLEHSAGQPWERLRYRDLEGHFSALPRWARFYLELGAFALPSTEQIAERQIIAAAIPTRSFAAAFTAVGAVLQDFGGLDDTRSNEEFFEHLCSMPVRTPVKLFKKDKNRKRRVYDGVLLGVERISGERMLKVQVEKPSMSEAGASGLTHFISVRAARSISLPANEDAVFLANLPIKQKGSKVSSYGGFASSVIGPQSIATFASESRMSCLVVGVSSVLKAEILENSFFCPEGTEGTLSELLRVKAIVAPGNPYRSNIFAANSRRPPHYDGESCPRLVIFDGASGLIKWRDRFPSSNWLVLLDEASPNFESGRDVLNHLYVQRNGSDPDIQKLPEVPSGVELLVFKEKVR